MDMPVNWGATAWQERVTVLNAILSRVQTPPGVEAAALSFSTEPPPLPGFLHTPAHTEGAREAHTVQMNLVSPEFFRTFQVPLIRGRLFTEAEVQEGRQVAVVNRTMARLLRGTDEEPVGRQVHISLRPWEVEGVGTPRTSTGGAKWWESLATRSTTAYSGQPNRASTYLTRSWYTVRRRSQ